MASISWKSAVNGQWSTKGSWSTGNVPTAQDGVTIGVTGATYKVTNSATSFAKTLTISSANATLDNTGSLTLGATGVLGALNVSAGTLIVDSGGTIGNANITLSGTGKLKASGGTLSGDTLNGTLDMSAAGSYLTVTNGLTLHGASGSGAGTVNLTGAGDSLTFTGTQTLDNATVNIGSSSGSSDYIYANSDGNSPTETLTLGANLSIVQAAGSTGYADLYSNGAGIVSKGTITAGASNGQFYIQGDSFTNQGQITVSNGETMYVQPTSFTNSGTVTVGAGSTLDASGTTQITNSGTLTVTNGTLNLGSFTNTGTISETNSTVTLSGAEKTSDLGTLTTSGGTINIAGSLTNTGTTLTIPTASGSPVYNLASNGTIVGGTIADGTGSLGFMGGTLSGVVYNGPLNITGANSYLTVTNGLTVHSANGMGRGTINLTGAGANLTFSGTQTLDNATINIGSANGNSDYIYANSDGNSSTETLTLGTNLNIVQASGNSGYADLYANSAAIVNQGTITAGVAGNSFYIQGGSFTNAGQITVSNGDTLYVDSTAFTNSATITVAAGSTLDSSGATQITNSGTLTVTNGTLNLGTFTNTGTISETNSTVTLSGAEKTADLGTLTTSGGTINIAGTLTNTGTTLTIPTASGSPVYNLSSNGIIVGGTIADATGSFGFTGGMLSGVVYNGPLNITGSNSYVTVTNGLTLHGAGGAGAGTINLTGGGDSLTFTGTQTLDNATINFGSASGNSDYIYANSDGNNPTETLTLGSNLNIVQAASSTGYVDLYSNSAGIVSKGTITAGAANAQFYIQGTSFTNQGQITVSNGETMYVQPTSFTNSGTITVGAGSTLDASGTTTFTNLSGTTLTGGTFVVGAGSTFELANNKSIATLSANVTLSGTGSTIQGYNTTNNKQTTFDSTFTIITAAGQLHLLANRSLTSTRALTDSGLLELGGGTLQAMSLTVGSGGAVRGFGTIKPAVSDSGTVEAQGGILLLQAAVSGSGALQVDTNSTLELGSTASETVTFNGFKGTLKLDSPSGYTGTLASLAAGDTIDLAGTSATAASISGGKLNITVSGGSTLSYNVSGAAANTRLATASDGHGGTNVTMYNLAQASAASPNPVSFANAHVGDTVTQALTVTNAAPANGYSETLDGSLGTATTGVTASGSFTGLAAGASDSTDLKIGLDTSSDGAKSGSATLTLASDGSGVDGLPNASLPSQTIQASGNVYAYAAPTFSTTLLNFGAARVGDTTSASTVMIGDGTSADAYQESLVYSAGAAPGGFTVVSGGNGTVASGSSASLGLQLSTATAGDYTGSTLTVGLTSTGVGTSGLADTALPGQSLTLNGKVYATAVAQLSTTNLNLGIVHVGDNVSGSLGIMNVATGALTDVLTGGFGSVTGPFSGIGTLGGGVAAGQSGALTIGLDTSQSGAFSGSATLALASHDSDLTDAAVSAGPVQLQATVDNYATAAFEEVSGGGTLSQSGNAYTLNLGQITEGSTESINLGVYNSASGLADLLSGNFTVTGDSAFMNAAFDAFAGLGAGQADTNPIVMLNTSQAGTFSETITLHSTGSNASGYSGALTDETFTITGTVIAPPVTMADTGYVSRGMSSIAGSLLLANDSDPNGQPLSIQSVQNPTNGSVSLSGQTVSFNSSTDPKVTSAGFDYTATDGSASSTAHVGLTLVTTTTGNDNKTVNTLAGQFSYIDGMAGNDRLTGGAGTDTLIGGIGNDILNGGTGADIMYGGAGDDTYYVDNPNDVVSETTTPGVDDGGKDTVDSSISYTLGSYLENLTLTGTGAINGTGNSLDNTITGNSAANTLLGGGGNDRLIGNGGADTMDGGDGSDIYYVDAYDTVSDSGTTGTDTVVTRGGYTLAMGNGIENLTQATGTTNASTLTGNELNNRITGSDGNNYLKGLAGADYLTGGLGDDKLEGGTGQDTLVGGAGADTFIFKGNDSPSTVSPAAYDTIMDFASGTDKIDLDVVTGSSLTASQFSNTSVSNNNYSVAFSKAQSEFADALHKAVYVAGTTDGWLFWNNGTGPTTSANESVRIFGGNSASDVQRADIV